MSLIRILNMEATGVSSSAIIINSHLHTLVHDRTTRPNFPSYIAFYNVGRRQNARRNAHLSEKKQINTADPFKCIHVRLIFELVVRYIAYLTAYKTEK